MSFGFKGVIFDLDGTIADTSEDLSAAINLMRESFGFERISKAEVLKHINNGARAFVNGCLSYETDFFPEYKNKDFSEKFLEDAFNRYLKFYAEHYLENTKLYNGIYELVKALDEKKIKMCVLSNKHDDMTKRIVKELLGNNYFVEILGGSERFLPKPNPGSALYLAGQMGIAPDEILYVGDSDIDMKTAVDSGMFALGVLWGYRPENILIETGAKKTVNNPDEILDFVLNNYVRNN